MEQLLAKGRNALNSSQTHWQGMTLIALDLHCSNALESRGVFGGPHPDGTHALCAGIAIMKSNEKLRINGGAVLIERLWA